MEQIDLNRLGLGFGSGYGRFSRREGWELKSLADGSVRIMIYDTVKTDKPLLELLPQPAYGDNRYGVKVNIPEGARLLAVIVLYRPAKNRYVCVVSDDRETSESSFNNLSGLSEELTRLSNKYKPAVKSP